MQGPIPNLVEGSRELDWTFVGNRKLTLVSTNDVYHTIIASRGWVEELSRKVWSVYKPLLWWIRVICLG